MLCSCGHLPVSQSPYLLLKLISPVLSLLQLSRLFCTVLPQLGQLLALGMLLRTAAGQLRLEALCLCLPARQALPGSALWTCMHCLATIATAANSQHEWQTPLQLL